MSSIFSVGFQKSASIQSRTGPDKFAVIIGLASSDLGSFLSLVLGQFPRSRDSKGSVQVLFCRNYRVQSTLFLLLFFGRVESSGFSSLGSCTCCVRQ